jgi:hypothetical protein
VSFLAFCAANVLMDIEPMYYILTRQYRSIDSSIRTLVPPSSQSVRLRAAFRMSC